MPSEGDTFLPRIQSVFYAVFDVRQGPKIVYQVPEGLVAVSSPGLTSTLSASSSPVPSTPVALEADAPLSRRSSSSLISIGGQRIPRYIPSPQQRSSSSNRVLFNFDDISKYVIPPSALCGRLVICATGKYRIIGFPVALQGNYDRNYFRYNLCFVFERTADLSCYEPIVRKVSSVLTSCEEESAFLSSAQSAPAMYAILEQLYEDLNSYSETSIPIDAFNSIELKIFPFYPNPPAVKDWMVPLALINLSKRIEDNWDLTMKKVCRFIDGVNHVSRIAQLADCDLELTRQAISHLLYYQVIMTIDIFQYSNMYTLRKNVQWLADESHVREECGPYVTKPGRPLPDWPKLLHLYSRLKPGRTVLEWMESHDVHEMGIDVRRFTSFGVIKGFLRRVHRWPILLPAEPASPATRKRRSSVTMSPLQVAAPPNPPSPEHMRRFRGRLPDSPSLTASITAKTEAVLSSPTAEEGHIDGVQIQRRTSAAEKVLEQLRIKNLPRSGSNPNIRLQSSVPSEDLQERRARVNSDARRNPIHQHSNAGSQSTLPVRPRMSRSPSAPMVSQIYAVNPQGSVASTPIVPPPELLPLLDGEHHTDELSTRFEAGWPLLQQWLAAIGGGKGDGDFGRVLIIYR
ncbi:nitrogen permease regulator 2-domain-containing protein [Hygrophoropsis aurantiaca]|uniref:Nitrogen permease regulator 2-domain-containing protein n=1 Tax=Hygrophoropsis aurantiaca TaxID=72124 RepID=A0ACB8AI74_9AGAM|nr:nitrogen permease regulator 2-domain-containing protein [Hygrophoropsis aurantiaca]